MPDTTWTDLTTGSSNTVGQPVDAATVVADGTETARPLADWFGDEINILALIPLGEQAAIRARTSAYDCTPAFHAAKDLAAAKGGAVVRVPAGTYNVTGLVWDRSAASLVGDCGGYLFGGTAKGTVLKYVGTAGGAALTVQAPFPAGSGPEPVTSVRIENIAIDGENVAGTGLQVLTAANCEFRNILIDSVTARGVYTGVVAEDYPALNCVYQCAFESIFVRVTGSADGFVFDGDPGPPGGNCTTFCRFLSLHVTYADGTAYKLVDCDTNTFINIGVSRIDGGTGIGIELGGSNIAGHDYAHHNFFYGVWAGLGGIVARGAGLAQPSAHNVILGVSNIDAAPLPTVESGATLYYVTIDGAMRMGAIKTDQASGGGAHSNQFSVYGSDAGGGEVQFRAEGADSNLNMVAYTKGTGAFLVRDNGDRTLLRSTKEGEPANYVESVARPSGSGATIRAAGSDTNAPLRAQSKGSSPVLLGQTDSANEIAAYGSASGGGGVSLRAQGTDANLAFDVFIKGASGIFRVQDENSAELLRVSKIDATPVNFVQLAARSTGNAPRVQAQGSATDIPLYVGAKGAGDLQLGASTNKIGFFGVTPATRPVLSYSRTGEGAAAAALRSALAALGLVTDSTTA